MKKRTISILIIIAAIILLIAIWFKIPYSPVKSEFSKDVKERIEKSTSVSKAVITKEDFAAFPPAIQKYVEQRGFGVVRDYVGHGVGRNLHEDPEVPNFGKAGHGLRLVSGMVIAIEPMITAGTFEVEVLSNDWTVVTKDSSLAAHFEHTIAITPNGPIILTTE